MVVNKTYHIAGFLSAFCSRGGKMRDCMDYWGGQANICVQSMMQTRGSRGMPGGNFDFFRHNLVESGTVFAQT